jgi:hypothetical protein
MAFACAGCPQEAAAPQPWAALPVVVSSADATSVSLRLEGMTFDGREADEVAERGSWKAALPAAVRAKLEAAGFKIAPHGGAADLVASIHATDVEWTGRWWETRGNVILTLSNPADQTSIAHPTAHFAGVDFSAVPEAMGASLADALLRSAELAQFVQAKRAREQAALAPPPPPPPPPLPPPPPPPPKPGLEPSAVKPVLAPLRARYRACYDAGLIRDANLGGKVVLKLDIAPSGALTAVEADTSSTLSDAGVTGCIVEATKPLTFPAAERKTDFTYPIELTPGAPPEVSKDGLEAIEIHKVIRGVSDKTRACFEAGLKKDPALAGTLKLKFSIGGKGTLLKMEAAPDSTLKAADVQKCVLDAVRGLSFPKPKKRTDVVYPLELRAPD